MKMPTRIVALLATIALLVACGGQENATSTTQPAPEPPASEAAISPAPDATPPETPARDVLESAARESVEESAGEEAVNEEVEQLLQAALADKQPDANREWRYSAGKYYSQLTAAQGTTGGAGGIEVTEVFWYGCPHCYSFDPYIDNWQATLPEDVRFVRLPVMWNPTNEIHARVYYTAEVLNKLGEMHEAIFNAFHRENRTLTNENDIRNFFADFGVSRESFDKTFRSFAVESKLKRAKALTERYRIRSVPVLVVNGKYITDGPEVKSFEDMLAVADELVEREREEL